MKPTTVHPHKHLLFLAAVIAVLIPANAAAQLVSISHSRSAAGLALARYVSSTKEGNGFVQSGLVAVMIEASLPGLYKQSTLVAVRQTGESGHSEYQMLQMAGDATAAQEVIAPYLVAQQEVEQLPLSSVAILPANYKFTYMGEVGAGLTTAYKFRIMPKKKRSGLIDGELWIDAATGVAVLQAGHFVKPPSDGIRRMNLVRDTKLLEGNPAVRITHISMDTQLVGRGELTITEIPMNAIGGIEPSQFPGSISQ